MSFSAPVTPIQTMAVRNRNPAGLLVGIALSPIDPLEPDWFARVLVAVLGLLNAAGAVIAIAS